MDPYEDDVDSFDIPSAANLADIRQTATLFEAAAAAGPLPHGWEERVSKSKVRVCVCWSKQSVLRMRLRGAQAKAPSLAGSHAVCLSFLIRCAGPCVLLQYRNGSKHVEAAHVGCCHLTQFTRWRPHNFSW